MANLSRLVMMAEGLSWGWLSILEQQEKEEVWSGSPDSRNTRAGYLLCLAIDKAFETFPSLRELSFVRAHEGEDLVYCLREPRGSRCTCRGPQDARFRQFQVPLLGAKGPGYHAPMVLKLPMSGVFIGPFGFPDLD